VPQHAKLKTFNPKYVCQIEAKLKYNSSTAALSLGVLSRRYSNPCLNLWSAEFRGLYTLLKRFHIITSHIYDFTRPTTMHFVLSLFILQPSLKLLKCTNDTCWQPFRFVYLFSHRVCYFIFPVLHHGLLSKDLVTKDAYWRIV